ncbi:MAG: hypothetical protein ACI91R_001418 [Vicingaceae bacterium]|jgi:hypothetical protein
MDVAIIKTTISLVLMIAFLTMSFITNEAENEQLFASSGIITGAYLCKFLSTQNSTTNEKH